MTKEQAKDFTARLELIQEAIQDLVADYPDQFDGLTGIMEPDPEFKGNFVMTCPPGMKDCTDLHVFKHAGRIISQWTMGGLIHRIHFLMTGKMTLCIFGQGMPPLSLWGGVIDQEAEQQAHG